MAMRRTTILLPPRLHSRAVKEARRRKVSLGALIRDLLSERLAKVNADRDPFLSEASIYHGPAPKDGAVNHDHYIYDLDEP